MENSKKQKSTSLPIWLKIMSNSEHISKNNSEIDIPKRTMLISRLAEALKKNNKPVIILQNGEPIKLSYNSKDGKITKSVINAKFKF